MQKIEVCYEEILLLKAAMRELSQAYESGQDSLIDIRADIESLSAEIDSLKSKFNTREQQMKSKILSRLRHVNGVLKTLSEYGAPDGPTVNPRLPQPVVYFMQCSDTSQIKIGNTTQLSVRKKQIESERGYEVEVLRTVPGGLEEERRIQKMFKHLNVRGEWFRPDKALLKYIEEIDPYIPHSAQTPSRGSGKLKVAEESDAL